MGEEGATCDVMFCSKLVTQVRIGLAVIVQCFVGKTGLCFSAIASQHACISFSVASRTPAKEAQVRGLGRSQASLQLLVEHSTGIVACLLPLLLLLHHRQLLAGVLWWQEEEGGRAPLTCAAALMLPRALYTTAALYL